MVGFMGERLQQLREDVLTVPNALSVLRLAGTPLVAKRLHDDPEGTWPQAAAFLLSDNADGILARAGDKSETLSNLGFRTSEFGRQVDPVADVASTSAMLVAGMRNGVVPKWLGGAALAEKAFKSAHTVLATARGAELHVSKLGKRSAFATNVSIGMLFPGEQIENEEQKANYRKKWIALAAAGIVGSLVADIGYIAQANRQKR
jgi:cardiolipin synthase